MSGSSFGKIFQITTFGESHGAALGVIVDGMPAGVELDRELLDRDMARRRPGQSDLTTSRKEDDGVEILSGVMDGVFTGTPVAMLIRNTSQRSKDYGNLAEVFRPGHADYGYFAKYGIRDYRGGGRSSGRETCARVAAGALAKMVLKSFGVNICAWAAEIAGIKAESFDAAEIEKNSYEVPKVFKIMQQRAGITDEQIYNTFNMGIGMVVCVAPENVEAAMASLQATGEEVVVIGKTVAGTKGVILK